MVTTGHALDIGVGMVAMKELIDYFTTKVTGLGVAKTFIHIDNLTYEHGFKMRPNAEILMLFNLWKNIIRKFYWSFV